MARRVAPLTELHCQRAKYNPEGGNKLFDGGGLFLELRPNGVKLWRLKYRFAGKEKLLALGAYPDISREAARSERSKARTMLATNIDPCLVRKAAKRSMNVAAGNTFEGIAREWFERFSPGWALAHSSKVIGRLEKDVFPWLGHRPIAELDAPEILEALRRVEARGALDTARRVRQYFGQVFRYAIATSRAKRDPSADLRGAIAPPPKRHYATVTEPLRIGELLRAIDGYHGTYTTRAALQLAPLVFVRPGELRKAEWSEFDLDKAEWRIPPERLKLKMAAKLTSRHPHIVPLATQVSEILLELQRLTGSGRYVFPSVRTGTRAMSDNTVNAGLRRLGFEKTEIVGHGFRHMASTLLNERGWSPDAIERQLAHKPQGVRAVYNLAEYLPERRRMMQAWADYLDALRAGLPGAVLGGPLAKP